MKPSHVPSTSSLPVLDKTGALLLNHMIITENEDLFRKYKLVGSVEITGHLRAYGLKKVDNEAEDQNCMSYY
jgi:hypothetical protein